MLPMGSRRVLLRNGLALLLVTVWLSLLPATSYGQLPDASAPAVSTGPSSTDASRNAAPATSPTTTDEPSTADAPPKQRLLQPPADPTAAAAYGVLEKHCARCHQGGRLNRAAPAAGLGNILRLDEIAGAPFLIKPGNPDASRLYLMMLRRVMPFDVHAEGSAEPAPTADEIALVRTWIAGLPRGSECRDRRLVTPADHAKALTQVASLPDEPASRLRFLSIAHLHNGCVSFDALAAYRQAVVHLFNSLSWKPAPIAVPPIDPQRTLFKLNLDDIGWLPEHWERIMQAGTDPLGLSPRLDDEAHAPFGTSIPIARADWFAATVLTAPLYYDVLGLPGTGPEILKILQIDAQKLYEGGSVIRAGIARSRFAAAPSLIERLPAKTGAFWQAHHAFAKDNSVDLSQLAARSPLEPIPHHASRSMFTLPNGLPAFFVVGQRGDRLDILPPDIALPSVTMQGEVRGGLDCLACHAGGPAARDPSSLPRLAADAVDADRGSVSDAFRRIGIDPVKTLDGVEPIVALANEHTHPLDAVRAAAEHGVSTGTLEALADQSDGIASILARRLVQGLVTRQEVEARAQDLIIAIARLRANIPTVANGPVAPQAALEMDYRPVDAGPGLILYSDKARYKKGDLLSLVVRVSAECHLTLVSVDRRGRGTVIFPSDFESNTLLTAGQELRLPSAGAPYAFRLNESGRETIVALCNEGSTSTDGIRHDFERQRFTDLGNYATFLAQNAIVDTTKADSATQRRPEPRPRSARRRGKTDAPDERSAPERIARTAITIVVD